MHKKAILAIAAAIALVAGSSSAQSPDPLALKVDMVLTPKATAHFKKGQKLKVTIGYRGLPIKAKGRKFTIEEDDLAWLGNSKEVVVATLAPIVISPPPAVRAQQSWVKTLMVSAHGTQNVISSDYRAPFLMCHDGPEVPITVARKAGLRLKCQMSTE